MSNVRRSPAIGSGSVAGGRRSWHATCGRWMCLPSISIARRSVWRARRSLRDDDARYAPPSSPPRSDAGAPLREAGILDGAAIALRADPLPHRRGDQPPAGAAAASGARTWGWAGRAAPPAPDREWAGARAAGAGDPLHPAVRAERAAVGTGARPAARDARGAGRARLAAGGHGSTGPDVAVPGGAA